MSHSATHPVDTPLVTPPLTTTLSHKSEVSHQFEDAGQQKEAAALGMWLFLATEVLLFGGIFTAYVIYRERYFPQFAAGANDLWATLGIANTVVLLTSSLFMALSVHAAHNGHRQRLVVCLLITIALGLAFLGIKAVEYTTEYKDGLVPFFGWWKPSHEIVERWKADHLRPEQFEQIKLFYIFYFFMTALHGLHMVAGASVLAVITIMAHKGKFTSTYYNPVEISGLYWHFVDIVWVFLLPTLYLVHPS